MSPDLIDDVPSTKQDPYPAFDNFAWRAFVALAWPALTQPAHRGEPDRAKTLADPGPRVWETFKSRYEVFQRGPDGRPRTPEKWTSYDSANPCGAEADKRTKTSPRSSPSPTSIRRASPPGKFLGPLVAEKPRLCALRSADQSRLSLESIVAHRWFEPDRTPSLTAPAHFNVGSIAVKAAWRILDQADTAAIRSRYYVVDWRASGRCRQERRRRQAGLRPP